MNKSELLAELKGKLNRFKFLRMGVDEKVLTDWLSDAITHLVESVPCEKDHYRCPDDQMRAIVCGYNGHVKEVEMWKAEVLK